MDAGGDDIGGIWRLGRLPQVMPRVDAASSYAEGLGGCLSMKNLAVKGPFVGGANFGGSARKAGVACRVDKVGPRYVRRPKAQFGDHWRTDGSWERHKFLPVVSQCFWRYGSATGAAIRKLVAGGSGDEGQLYAAEIDALNQ